VTAENSFIAVIALKLKGFPNFRANLSVTDILLNLPDLSL